MPIIGAVCEVIGQGIYDERPYEPATPTEALVWLKGVMLRLPM